MPVYKVALTAPVSMTVDVTADSPELCHQCAGEIDLDGEGHA